MDRKFQHDTGRRGVTVVMATVGSTEEKRVHLVVHTERGDDGAYTVKAHEKYRHPVQAMERWESLTRTIMRGMLPESRQTARLNDNEKERQLPHLFAIAAESIAAEVPPFEVLDRLEKSVRLLIRGVPVMDDDLFTSAAEEY